ncbi:KaiC domain-containing protein [Halobellus salinisoli]|uniref:KaiC domain-containing protein n=1 Tax=Halobellus salinisoli TaxID=3108500 RepID=UPI003CE4C1A9
MGGDDADESTDESEEHAESEERSDGVDGEEHADGVDGEEHADGVGSEEPTGTHDVGDRVDGPEKRGDSPENNAAEKRGVESPGGDDGREDDEGPFEQDFATALGNAPEPEGGDFSGETGSGPPPTGGGVDSDAPDFGGFDEGRSGFSERQGEFGEDRGGFDEDAFDEESFESDLDRLDIGIEGLDKMILGGVPRRSLMVAIGSAGTGKTTFGLQFLNHGLERGDAAVYITLEESHERILATASEKGWDFESYVDDGQLAIVDIDPVEMANSLDSIQNDLPDLIEEFGADRLVLDSVSLLEMMYQRTPKRRSQVFGFARALKRAGITTLLTSEASEDNPYASRFGIVEYLADAVFVMQYVRESDFRETRLAIEIQKIRDANHSRATKPYELTGSGISVYRQANIF